MKKIFIFGAGAVGTALAIHLTLAGRRVALVRVRQRGIKRTRLALTHDEGGELWNAEVECLSLDQIGRPEGLLVVTTKAFANPYLAEALVAMRARGPICVLQNGMGVEQPFLDRGFSGVCRGILYVTGEKASASRVSLKVLQPSWIGNAGEKADLTDEMVGQLTTAVFPFQRSDGIEREVWKKTIVNSVFNSICPLLDIDNGIFARSVPYLSIARDVVRECVAVASRTGVQLGEESILEQVLKISSGSRHFISTLQDLRNQRPTEIEFFNLAVVGIAEALDPPLAVPNTKLLGELIRLKAFAYSVSQKEFPKGTGSAVASEARSKAQWLGPQCPCSSLATPHQRPRRPCAFGKDF